MRKPPYLNIGLFIATVFTTVMAGALQRGYMPFADSGWFLKGVPFSASLMAILLTHELGHYFSAKFHRVDATLPYFIPAPSIIGTFGALIKMRSPIATRRALIEIGASGPIAGFIVSIAATIAGLYFSTIGPSPATDEALALGDSLIFNLLSWLVLGPVAEGQDVFLHPIAFAGWLGFFVTSLNLIPVGQLDGGHIVYGLFGQSVHKYSSYSHVLALGIIGGFFWPGWAFWGVVLIILGLRHPPVIFQEPRLDLRLRLTGMASLSIFVLTFTPTPFSGMGY